MILGIHHATFISSDLARSRDFYEGVLGLQPDPRRPLMSFDGIWYHVAAGQQIHLMLLPDPEVGLTRPIHGGRDRHVAFMVEDVKALAAHLLSAGVAFTLSQSGRQALFCRDPDGNALEFVQAQP
jgi:catechol 2,3-dioxygenase-like lactoylglutathione lyase family enzyme